MLTGLDPTSDHPAFGTELFAPIYATTSLPADKPQEFLANAVDFANDRLTGNLSASLIIDPATAKRLGPSLEDRVAESLSGSVALIGRRA